jgi:hypothetical protein
MDDSLLDGIVHVVHVDRDKMEEIVENSLLEILEHGRFAHN